MKKTIVANWKMNLPILSEWNEVIKSSTPPFSKKGRGHVEVVICPPFIYIERVGKFIEKSNIKLGAQDVFWETKGAYTGEISPKMLKSSKVSYVIVGHSERRTLGETDKMINKKIKAALREKLKVILCVGEPWSVRKKGLVAAKRYVKSQLQKNLQGISKGISNVIAAYEPVWAIGTGKADKPQQTVEMVKFIKDVLKVRVLYGGSVTAKNAARFLNQEEIDGALVGGASLKASEFIKIIEAAR